jgi:hypothetical protein
MAAVSQARGVDADAKAAFLEFLDAWTRADFLELSALAQPSWMASLPTERAPQEWLADAFGLELPVELVSGPTLVPVHLPSIDADFAPVREDRMIDVQAEIAFRDDGGYRGPHRRIKVRMVWEMDRWTFNPLSVFREEEHA